MSRPDPAPDPPIIGPVRTPGRRNRPLSRRDVLLLGGGVTAGVVASAVLATAGRPSALPAAVVPEGLGLLPVEEFRSGDLSDDEVVEAAVRHAAARTRPPAIVFADRDYDLTRPVLPFSGMHLLRFPYGDEFRETAKITLPSGGLLAFDRDVRSVTLENLSCRLRDHLLAPIPRDNSAGAWTDVRVLGGGFVGGRTVLEGAFLRLAFQPAYINGVSDSVLRIGGSDCWLFTAGPHYVGGTLAADRPFLDLDHLGQSVLGDAYITAQGGYGVRIRGNATGLRLAGTMVDATGRSGPEATQLAGLQIEGGATTTVDDLWVFNANASGRSPASVTVTGGSGVVFTAPRFPGANGTTTVVDRESPCIHTTVPITVVAPVATGRARLITATEPGLVTLVGAPDWEVRVV